MTNAQTIINTRIFFNKKLDNLIAIADRHKMDLLPENLENLHPFDNDYPFNLRYAERITYCVAMALNSCSKPYQKIIITCYLKCIPDNKQFNQYNISRSTYYRQKHQALNEFSQRFNFYVVKEGINPPVKLVI